MIESFIVEQSLNESIEAKDNIRQATLFKTKMEQQISKVLAVSSTEEHTTHARKSNTSTEKSQTFTPNSSPNTSARSKDISHSESRGKKSKQDKEQSEKTEKKHIHKAEKAGNVKNEVKEVKKFPKMKEIRKSAQSKCSPKVHVENDVVKYRCWSWAKNPSVNRTRDYEQWERVCGSILRVLEDDTANSRFFLEPIAAYGIQVDEYTQMIGDPLDLEIIRQKLETGKYVTSIEFMRDVRKMLENALKFNADPEEDKVIQQATMSLSKKFEDMVKSCFDQGGMPRYQSRTMFKLNDVRSLGPLLQPARREDRWRVDARQILDKIMKHPDALGFLHPVDIDNVPGYKDIIRRPMDLSSISLSLKKGKYRVWYEFAADIETVFANCLQYNADPIADAKFRFFARNLRWIFRKAYPVLQEASLDQDQDVQIEDCDELMVGQAQVEDEEDTNEEQEEKEEKENENKRQVFEQKSKNMGEKSQSKRKFKTTREQTENAYEELEVTLEPIPKGGIKEDPNFHLQCDYMLNQIKEKDPECYETLYAFNEEDYGIDIQEYYSRTNTSMDLKTVEVFFFFIIYK